MSKSKDIEAWGRHFDTLLWTFTAIVITAIGGLLFYTFRNFNLLLAILGFVMTLVAVFFAASFRNLRHMTGRRYPTEIKAILICQPDSFIQGPIYFSVFIILGLLWMGILIQNILDLSLSNGFWWWVCFELFGMILIVCLGMKSMRKRKHKIIFGILVIMSIAFTFLLLLSNKKYEMYFGNNLTSHFQKCPACRQAGMCSQF